MNIAITGVTGLLGSNLLVEIIKHFNLNLDNLKLILFGREKECSSLQERICKSVQNCFSELFDEFGGELIVDFLREKVKYVNIELDKESLGISNDDQWYLTKTKIDVFFHCCACTDFRNSPSACEMLDQINIEGTKRILKLVDSLNVSQLCYVGSAYSCGMAGGNILPDYVTTENKFRNHYEYTKLKAELEVRNYSELNKRKYRIFRTSTICGRLIDPPIGHVNKYDVFYAWVAFFLRIKMKTFIDLDDLYNTPFKIDARICINPQSGLNIVPVDYIAKTMLLVVLEDHFGKYYHIVNNSETPHSLYVPLMAEAINLQGLEYVRDIPNSKNSIESMYYKTVGAIYTPYVTSQPMYFDNSNLDEFSKKHNLYCPPVDEYNFKNLMNFAKNSDFGLKKNQSCNIMG